MSEETINALVYAVRPRVVLKYCGQLALMLAILTLVPLLFSILDTDWQLTLRFIVLCSGLVLGGILLARIPAPMRIQSNEALTVTAIMFLLTPLLMSWPIMAAGTTYFDALFEAVSSITTTGLSTLGSIQGKPDTLLFTRAWMQWYGGLGIIVLSVALLMGHQAVARRLTEPVEGGDTLITTARLYARRTLIVYVILTLAGLAIVWSLSGNPFASLLHVLAAVSTGGFSNTDTSLAGFESKSVSISIMLISFLGAISLPLYWRAVHAGWRQGLHILVTDVELRALFLGCLLVGGLLSGINWLQGTPAPWYHGFMMGISAQTTTGFTTQTVATMEPGSKLIMIISMLVGGSVGSSAGGIKLLRLLILLRLLQLMLRRTGLTPHAVLEPMLGGQRLENDDLIRALQVILLFAILVIVSWLPFVVMGYDPLDALFEVASACGTVGLSSGITRPGLEAGLKGVLCFDMLAGRLEVIALLLVMYPRNWIGRREEV